MARGYPDFFGFSIFPFYGVLYRTPVAAIGPILNVETDLVEITGKGILTAGQITGVDVAINANPWLAIYVDGGEVFATTMEGLYAGGWLPGVKQLMVLNYKAVADRTRIVHFPLQIPFGQSLRITCRDNAAVGVNFVAYLYYYQIL